MAKGGRLGQYLSDADLIDTATRLLSFPSWKGCEDDLALWLAEYFDERAYDVELQEVEPGRHQTIATIPGTGGGRSLMLNGHLDIDPIRAGWRRDPFRPVVEGDLLYGAGCRNMKAGVSTMIAAVEAVRKSQTPLAGDVVVACVVGELHGGVGTTYALAHGVHTDAAIVPEPVGANHVVTTTSGALQLAITTRGVSEDTSRAEHAVSALEMMVPVIQALGSVEFECYISAMSTVSHVIAESIVRFCGEADDVGQRTRGRGDRADGGGLDGGLPTDGT